MSVVLLLLLLVRSLADTRKYNEARKNKEASVARIIIGSFRFVLADALISNFFCRPQNIKKRRREGGCIKSKIKGTTRK